MDNLSFWDRWATVPKAAQKTIKGGRLNGFTDINPVWRYKVLTDTFGPCGFGWKYTVERLWCEPVKDEILAFAEVTLSYKDANGDWSQPIPGIGGSKLAQEEKGGVRPNDEGYKMAITDALSVACKALGVGADIYWAAGGDSKYPSEPATFTPAVETVKVQSNARGKRLNAIKSKYNLTTDQFAALRNVIVEMGVVPDKLSKDWTDTEFEAFIGALETEAAAVADERAALAQSEIDQMPVFLQGAYKAK